MKTGFETHPFPEDIQNKLKGYMAMNIFMATGQLPDDLDENEKKELLKLRKKNLEKRNKVM